MRGLNKVTLIGHLGKDPEVQSLEGGATVAKCTMATTEAYRDKEGNLHSETE
jgi:single-strand DNA-binding protein